MRLEVVLSMGLTACSFRAAVNQHDALVGDTPLDDPVDSPAIDGSNACSTAGLTCASGLTNHVTCNGKCWVSCIETANIPDQSIAVARCTGWGGKLAPIRSAQDNDCVANVIFPTQASWIGLEQLSGQATPGAGWSWNGDGIPPAYLNWTGGQPNDGDGTENDAEQCSYMPTIGSWQDIPCTGQTLFRFSCSR